MVRNVAVDLGTANVVIYTQEQGIVLREPSVAAVTTDGRRKVIAAGEEANRMIGRTPEGLMAVKPLRDGVIADFRITDDMLRLFSRKAIGKKKLFSRGYNMVICVPCNINSAEQRAVKDAARHAGARFSYIAEESLAAAIGAGIDINQPIGQMIVDIGGGTTEVAILSVGGVVVSKSLRLGGVKMDEAIISYMRKNYGMIIGEKTAENIKISVGCAIENDNSNSLQVRGRDAVSGMPMTVEVTSREICFSLEASIKEIIYAICSVLEEAPPEVAADVLEYGITLTGGGSLLNDIDKRITYETGIKATVAENPLDCVALGAGRIVEELAALKKRR